MGAALLSKKLAMAQRGHCHPAGRCLYPHGVSSQQSWSQPAAHIVFRENLQRLTLDHQVLFQMLLSLIYTGKEQVHHDKPNAAAHLSVL